MTLGRTLVTWLWLVFGTAVLGTLVLVTAPLDRRGRVWWSFVRAWAAGLSWAMGVSRLVIDGEERLAAAQGVLVMMNHTSGVDILAVIRARQRPLAFLAKRELFWFPFFGWVMRAAGMVPIDRRNLARAVASLDRAGDAIVAGGTLMLFPEGTRSRDGQLLPFKKGGFVLAHQRQLPILPVVIAGARAIHSIGWGVQRAGPVAVVVDSLIDPSAFADRDALMAHTRSRFVHCAERAERLLDGAAER